MRTRSQAGLLLTRLTLTLDRGAYFDVGYLDDELLVILQNQVQGTAPCLGVGLGLATPTPTPPPTPTLPLPLPLTSRAALLSSCERRATSCASARPRPRREHDDTHVCACWS